MDGWADAPLLLGTHGTPGTGTLQPWEVAGAAPGQCWLTGRTDQEARD